MPPNRRHTIVVQFLNNRIEFSYHTIVALYSRSISYIYYTAYLYICSVDELNLYLFEYVLLSTFVSLLMVHRQ